MAVLKTGLRSRQNLRDHLSGQCANREFPSLTDAGTVSGLNGRLPRYSQQIDERFIAQPNE